MKKITIKGAREHNLKNINLELPRDKLIVITGLSGSGKSSLAFDTIYAEGQRRYVESLSAYARQFLGQMEKPDVESIEGLSPAVSIDQKTTSRNPRSTVGTVTEIYDYLRLLYARVGTPHCPNCGQPIQKQTGQQITDAVLQLEPGIKFQILAPVVRGRKGEHRRLLESLKKEGFVRVKVDGQLRLLEEEIKLDKNISHSIAVVVDRLISGQEAKSRLASSLELALKLADGLVVVELLNKGGSKELVFSEHYACWQCGFSFEELQPRQFSFNSPYGACPQCSGLGAKKEIDPELVVANPELTLDEGAISPWVSRSPYYQKLITALAKTVGFSTKVPFRELPDNIKNLIFYGQPPTLINLSYIDGEGVTRSYRSIFEGVVPNLMRRYKETTSEHAREKIEQYMRETVCSACHGARLKPESLAVKVFGFNIYELTQLSISRLLDTIEQEKVKFTAKQLEIADRILKEIKARLQFLVDVGLDYLTLSRATATLSGGEAQRIRLATQIGSGLMGVLYILDEPTIGLHQRDNQKLINTLKRLRDLGNTLIVVEHDEATIKQADYIVDIGPGAGAHGGQVVAAGTLEEVKQNKNSLTGQYLSGQLKIETPAKRRSDSGKFLTIYGAQENNLKNIDVSIPLGQLVCVTGVSGSGKSSLVSDILAKALAVHLNRSKVKPGKYRSLAGLGHLDKVVEITQAPIGRTPRSNPATYTGVFSDIRAVFAATKEAKVRGYLPGRFSFNVVGGRCEACQGEGSLKIEMHFLPDVYVVCEVCKGKRYNEETLEVKYKGKNIAEVLDMSVEEALEFFAAIPKITRRLKTLYDVGLGYIKLGQPAPTLSGGEAQRVKLAAELAKVATGRTFYILDEPTTGLHFADVAKLLAVLHRLVDAGNTVVVIEHNLDVVKNADYIIDLGPEGGDNGGYLVACGPPEEIVKNERSYTGKFLAPLVNGGFLKKEPALKKS